MTGETRDSVPGSRSAGALVALVGIPVVAGAVVATQALARHAGYHEALGAPMWEATGVAYVLLVALVACLAAGTGIALVRRNRGGWALVLVLLALLPALVGAGLRPGGRRAVGGAGRSRTGCRLVARP